MKNSRTPKEWREEAMRLIHNLQQLDEQLFAAAKTIVNNPDNYTAHDDKLAQQKVLAAIQSLTELCASTGDTAHHHLASLHDLTKEDQVLLYPMTHLKFEAAENIKERRGNKFTNMTSRI